jgi:hypothetical protein
VLAYDLKPIMCGAKVKAGPFVTVAPTVTIGRTELEASR